MTQPGGNSPPAQARDPSRGSVKKFAAGAAGIAIILFTYYALTWRSHAAFVGVRGSCSNLFSDFVIYYYPMGEAVFRTGLPVSGFLYSPFIAILLAVFAPLGLNASLVLWGMLQAVFVILYLFLFRRLVPVGLPVQLLFVALVLSSWPVVVNLWWGQPSVFMIVGLLGMLVFSARGYRRSPCLRGQLQILSHHLSRTVRRTPRFPLGSLRGRRLWHVPLRHSGGSPGNRRHAPLLQRAFRCVP